MYFIDLLLRLGNDAPEYGNLLTAVSILVLIAYLVSLYGRAVYMQACRRQPLGWGELLRVDGRGWISYVYVSLLLYLTLLIFGVAIVTIPFIILLAGLAAAVVPDAPRHGVLMSLRAMAPYLGAGGVLAALMFVFSVAVFAVFVNLTLLTSIAIWFLSSFGSADVIRWQTGLEASFRYDLARVAAAVTIVEPFWLASMHVYADRVRSRRTGEDLLRRFQTLVRPAVAASLLLFAGAAHAESIELSVYVKRLEGVATALSAGRPSEATVDLEALKRATEVRTGDATFSPDTSLIAAVERAQSTAVVDPALVRRLHVTIAELRSASAKTEPVVSDTRVLTDVRAREKAGELWRGGEIMALPEADDTLFTTFARMWKRLIDWLAAKLERLFDAISALFTRRQQQDERSAFLGVPLVVWGVTLFVVAVVSFLAVYVLRRTDTRKASTVSEAAVVSKRDEDPLSREANEWESYARNLAATGRYREALRAWYHAVLRTLFVAGVLQYRKGLTNWEYVARLAPDLEWRPRFVAMTREFEREWYGQAESTPELLDSYASHANAVLQAVHGGRR